MDETNKTFKGATLNIKQGKQLSGQNQPTPHVLPITVAARSKA
jgi:hypothetical protein